MNLEKIDDNALTYLAKSPTLITLNTIDLTDSAVSGSQIDNLIKAKKFISEILY